MTAKLQAACVDAVARRMFMIHAEEMSRLRESHFIPCDTVDDIQDAINFMTLWPRGTYKLVISNPAIADIESLSYNLVLEDVEALKQMAIDAEWPRKWNDAGLNINLDAR
jgi:hypothetical protein